MTSTTAPTADIVAEFTAALFAPDDIVEIRQLPSRESTWHLARELHLRTKLLYAQNARGSNIYVGANPRRETGVRGDQSIDVARSLFADFDNCSTDDALSRITDSGLPRPTVVVRSGHGCHAYWRLDEPVTNMDLWRECQKALIELLGSDPSIHNPERIMRLPGFVNHKPPTAPCELVYADAAVACSLSDLHALLPGPVVANPVATPLLMDGAVEAVIAPGQRNATLTSLAGSMRRRRMGTEAILATLSVENASRCRPPLDAAEVRAIAESIGRYEPAAGRPWPDKIADAALYGLAGEIVLAIDPHTEADPVAVLTHVLVAAGNVVGRNAYFQVGGARHHLNLNVCNVGETSTGRKGTAWAEARGVFQGADPAWAAERQLGGMSSGRASSGPCATRSTRWSGTARPRRWSRCWRTRVWRTNGCL